MPESVLMRTIVTSLLSVVLATAAHAQVTDRGAFVVRLGTDTVSVESFTRTATMLVGDRVIRSPRVTLLHYEAQLGADGHVTRFTSDSRTGNRLDLPPLLSSSIAIDGDSAVIAVREADSTRRYVMRIRPGAVPMFNSTYALYGQMIRQMVRDRRDSMGFDMIMPGVLTAQPTRAWRLDRDSVAIDYFGSPLRARVDNQGRLLGLQASMTTVKVVVTRQDSADVAGLAHAFARAELLAGPMGQMSPRDTVRASIAGVDLLVDYGRPHMRGRTIFGGLVPLGKVWRTGANAATQFSTSAPIVIGDVTVPAGLYTLWSIPSDSGAELVINRQTGQWGTEYNPGQDLARIPMVRSDLPEPVEVFTIQIRPRGDRGGVLVFEWDRTRWEAEFRISSAS